MSGQHQQVQILFPSVGCAQQRCMHVPSRFTRDWRPAIDDISQNHEPGGDGPSLFEVFVTRISRDENVSWVP